MKAGNNNNFKEAQTTIEYLLGPIKIKDGLFIGDQFAAKVSLCQHQGYLIYY